MPIIDWEPLPETTPDEPCEHPKIDYNRFNGVVQCARCGLTITNKACVFEHKQYVTFLDPERLDDTCWFTLSAPIGAREDQWEPVVLVGDEWLHPVYGFGG